MDPPLGLKRLASDAVALEVAAMPGSATASGMRRASYDDLRFVGEAVAPARSSSLLVPQVHSPQLKRSKVGQAVCNLAEGLKAVQEHENELAEVGIVCEPEQASLMMGGLHPRGSLYERPVNFEVAKAQHAEFRNQVRQNAAKLACLVPHVQCM